MVPQAPQFMASTLVSTQAPLQAVSPLSQAHLLLLQCCPTVQATPQAPQFRSSSRTSTQAAPQVVRPLPQLVVQLPPLQTWLAPQTLPQRPQLRGSLAWITQTPLHRL